MKHFFRTRGRTAALLCLALVLAVAVNVCAVQATNLLGLRLDMTSDKLYALSDVTLEALEGLENTVQIRVFSTREDFLPLVSEILRRYELAGGGHVQVSYIDPYLEPTLVDAYLQRGLEIELGSILVEGERYARVLQLEDMFTLDESGSTVRSLNCESHLTSAILYAAGSGSPLAQLVTGHNENITDGLEQLFTQSNYTVDRLALSMERVDPEADLLVLAAPTADYSAEDIAALDGYMAGGGRLLVFAPPTSAKLPRLREFLAEWGVGLTDTVVAEPLQYTDANVLSIVPLYASHMINQYFANNQLYLVMPATRALEQLFVSSGGVRTQKLLYSTDRAYDYADPDRESQLFTLGMTAEKEQQNGTARLVVLGSEGLYSDSLLGNEACANARFLAQAVNWCTETESAVSVPARDLDSAPIAMTAGRLLTMAVAFVGVLPLSALLVGFAVYRRRRRS